MMLALSALIGVAIPYAVDTLAARISSARVIGTLFAIDPAMGTLIGWLLLDQALSPVALAGIELVALAGACVAWLEGPDATASNPPASGYPVGARTGAS
ncbi:hypothetical protein [Arthrobacter sp. JCM 19049]|uniref:hypothetical protein n=1 Tax=Arthrobacter sp. JCM 19049 TaxID=1460643 RepID=UPI000B08CFD4|nr:hypothetical protein [Arthrobacter sp. JCM 19049]